MAKKDETISMVDSFSEYMEVHKLDKTIMANLMEDSFRSVIVKMFGSDENFNVIANPEKGDCEIIQNFTVVEDGAVQNPNREISLSEARADDDPDCEVGEDHAMKIDFKKFGRRAILTLRQTIASKALDIKKEQTYNKFKDLEGELVTGTVEQTFKRELLVATEGNEKDDMILPRENMIPSDYFRKGDLISAVIEKVENKNNNPKIIISRTSNMFLQRLLEREVPEVRDGLISVRAIARIPGQRAKIAVESYDEHIDPVGACVGVKGNRIGVVVREMRNEYVDVIQYSSNPKLLIQRALSPAECNSIVIDEEKKSAEVLLSPENVNIAIGKNGLNIKLANELTGYNIDVYRDIELDDEDIYLEEFADEIDQWIIDALKGIGLDTAKAVLRMKREDLIDKADLEESTVDFVIDVLRREFED